MWIPKIFVHVNADGLVTGDNESLRKTWKNVPMPENMIEITGHPQWNGVGSLIGWRRNADGSFSPPGSFSTPTA